MVVPFPRLRQRVQAYPSSPCLERGEYGLDGARIKMNRVEIWSLRRSRCGKWAAVASCALLVLFLLFGTHTARKHAVSKIMQHIELSKNSDSCQPLRSEWVNVIHIPKGMVTMTRPRLVSRGSEVVQTLEDIEIVECPEKKIRRERHTVITVAFVPLDSWPWGREILLTLKDDAAVCVQHAHEMLVAKNPCEI